MLEWLPRRVRLTRAGQSESSNGRPLNVQLQKASGETFEGEAGADVTVPELKASAEATLEALRKVIGDVAELKLRTVMPVAVHGEDLVIVGVKITHGNETRSLFGLSPMGDDRARAAALATLNAANRYLGLG
jgi:hypothetical protein